MKAVGIKLIGELYHSYAPYTHLNVFREKIYAFFMSLKQPDGSFLVAHHAEVDVR